LAPKWHLAWEGGSKFYELSYWIWFVANCLNMIVDLSFMNSVTESGLVAKCSNILQDNISVYLSHMSMLLGHETGSKQFFPTRNRFQEATPVCIKLGRAKGPLA
jgi:hypothetical protein